LCREKRRKWSQKTKQRPHGLLGFSVFVVYELARLLLLYLCALDLFAENSGDKETGSCIEEDGHILCEGKRRLENCLLWKGVLLLVMGGGPMWRTAIRVVGSSSPSSAAVAPNAVLCRTGTTTPAIKSPASASISCTCNPAEVHRHHSAKQQPSSGSRQYWELEDWEFAAGGEEKDHLVFGTLPSRSEVEEATFELQDALRL
jgi:hypothetical protein